MCKAKARIVELQLPDLTFLQRNVNTKLILMFAHVAERGKSWIPTASQHWCGRRRGGKGETDKISIVTRGDNPRDPF